MAPDAVFLGVDVGGTQLRMATVRRDGRLQGDVAALPTGRGFDADALRHGLRGLIDAACRAAPSEPAALGFGIAGVVGRGPLSQCVNLPLLNGVDVEALVREVAGMPVALENDARCFTLGEARFGAARGARDVCGLSLGTGIGCGLLLDGRLRRGAFAQAGEIWQVPLRGEPLEHFVSGDGVVRGYVQAGGTPGQGLDAERVASRAREGDEAARRAWQSFGADLAWACKALITLVDPERIVIGGSLANARDLYGSTLRAELDGHPTRLVDAELGPVAGVVGAAALNIG